MGTGIPQAIAVPVRSVMLQLTPDEQSWLDEYRQVLDEQFPGLVDEFIVFGSKARGTATEDSDLDVLLIIREGDWWKKDEISHPGYDLASEATAVPSILVFTRDEWETRRRKQAPFWQTVTRDGVAVR